MGKRKNYKNLNFNSKEDYLYAANILIVRTYIALKKYKNYRDALGEFLDDITENNKQYIDWKIYEEWEDKQKNVSHNLLTCFVDETSTGFSYVMFRKLISRSQYAKILPALEKELEEYLVELRDVRNWTFHFAQSDFVAIKETIYGGLSEELKHLIQFVPNPIIVGFPQKVNRACIESLYLHMSLRIDIFEKLFTSMKHDYEILLGQEVKIYEALESPMELNRQSIASTQLSMAMQKKQYDGSKESFDKITLKGMFD